MKRKSQLLAWLMALCLLASLAVVPAAAVTAEDVTRLEQELNAAQNLVTEKQTALDTIKGEVATEKAGYESEKNSAQAELDEAQAALNSAGEDATNKDDLQKAVDAAKEKVDAVQGKIDAAEAKVTAAESELAAAKGAANAKEAELKAAQKELEASSKCTHGNDPDKCPECHPELKKCEHGNDPSKCPVCNPPATDKATHPDSDDITVSGYVDLGTLEKNASTSSRTGSFTVRNTSGFDMSFSAGTASGYKISAPSSISAGSSATVTVELNSSNGVGTYNRSLDMSVSFKDGDGQSYSFSTKLYAEVVEKGYALAADPASKDLGKLKEGYSEKEAKEKEVTVSIQNKGASSVRMDGVKGNDHFTVTAVGDDYETLKNGEKASYKIVPKQGLAVGTYTDTITFLTRENTNATFKATVVIEKKLDPLTVEPNPLDFGVAEEGYAALTQKTVTVKNNTDYAIRLNQPTSYSYEISLLSQTSLPAGSSATFTIRPRTGLPANLYDGVVEVYGSSNDNTLAAKLNVKFSVNRPAGPSTFSDVAAGSTFAADIAYVSQKGLMSGKGGGLFKPQESITRGQLVTILYRLEGQPAVSGAGFPDVAAGSYCEKAVKWAAANGITAGGKDGLFRPNDSITREQLATFLYRYNNYKGYVVAKQADLSAFSDSGSVSSYAKDALSWANGTGLVNGTSDGRLNPSGGATRGQAAAILHRFCVSIGR